MTLIFKKWNWQSLTFKIFWFIQTKYLSYLFFKARTLKICSKSKWSTQKPQILFSSKLCNPKRYSLFSGHQQKLKSIHFSFGSTWKGIFQFVRASRKPKKSIICTALLPDGSVGAAWENRHCDVKKVQKFLRGSISGLNFAGSIISPLLVCRPAAAAKSFERKAKGCDCPPKTQMQPWVMSKN